MLNVDGFRASSGTPTTIHYTITLLGLPKFSGAVQCFTQCRRNHEKAKRSNKLLYMTMISNNHSYSTILHRKHDANFEWHTVSTHHDSNRSNSISHAMLLPLFAKSHHEKSVSICDISTVLYSVVTRVHQLRINFRYMHLTYAVPVGKCTG